MSRTPKPVRVFADRKLETVPLSLPRLDQALPAAWLTPVATKAKPAFGAEPDPAQAGAPDASPSAKNVPDEAAIQEMADQARRNAEEEGLSQGREKLDEILRRYSDAVIRLEATIKRAERIETGAIVSLAVTVAREVLRSHLAVDPKVLAENVRAAIQAAGSGQGLKLRMGKADLAVLASQNPEIFDGAMEIVEDETLGVGGCIVEGERCAVDASLEARLELVADSLRALLGDASSAKSGESEAA